MTATMPSRSFEPVAGLVRPVQAIAEDGHVEEDRATGERQPAGQLEVGVTVQRDVDPARGVERAPANRAPPGGTPAGRRERSRRTPKERPSRRRASADPGPGRPADALVADESVGEDRVRPRDARSRNAARTPRRPGSIRSSESWKASSVPCAWLDAGRARPGDPAVARQPHHAQRRGATRQHAGRVVGRGIVDDDHLEGRALALREHRVEDAREQVGAIEGRDDDRNRRHCESARASPASAV